MTGPEYFDLWSFFTHPLLRGPTLGCLLIGILSGVIGVITFVKKESLIGESLSHAAYPGLTLAVVFATELGISGGYQISFFTLILTTAFFSSLLGYVLITYFQNRFSLSPDTSLCLILSTFFGIGITLASRLQFTHTALYKQIHSYVYGQSATMTDTHVWIYLLFSIFSFVVIFLFYRNIQALTFDPDFSITSGIPTTLTKWIVYPLIALTIVMGIRSVGVVLMSAMLIAPVSAGRQFTSSLKYLFPLSGLIGGLTAFLGNYLAIQGSLFLSYQKETPLTLPTGPVIVLTASCFCALALLFAPKDGFFIRLVRMVLFRNRCLRENLLKTLWKFSRDDSIPYLDLKAYFPNTSLSLSFALLRLKKEGMIEEEGQGMIRLTPMGKKIGAKIIRLHRLWELFLTSELGTHIERVHPSAEEMEHIITPEIEERLTKILGDPKFDPHLQPIPPNPENREKT